MQQFNKGDTVALKSPGPTMTILEIQENGWITCSWYDGKKFNTEVFPSESLRPVNLTESKVYIA